MSSTSAEPNYAPPPGPPPSHNHSIYVPPSGPPPNHEQPTSPFRLLSPSQAHCLATQGFTTFPISQRPALFDAANALFGISRTFFAEPFPHKEQFQVRTGNAQGSEEGWSRVVGEKELLTVRRGGVCPISVEEKARTLWKECGALMQEMTCGVEQSLGMSRGALDGVVNAECQMPEAGSDRLETLLRMFRYERRSLEADNNAADAERQGKGRLVAEQHRDLGILSLVIGASPGLEVWDTSAEAWIPIEEPPYAGPGLTATLLVGETLTRLTNARYAPGRHRVFVPSAPAPSDPAASDPESQYRYSLVFALRPHADALIDTAALTTPLTGAFAHPLQGVRARELFTAIARTHWNVNTGVKEREAQRMRLQGGAAKGPLKENGQEQTEDSSSGDEPRDGKKKKRWSMPHFNSSSLPPEEEKPRRKRWSLFQRVSGRAG